MHDPNEKMVYCLESIVKELHVMNKQLKIMNQIAAMADVHTFDAPDIVKQRAVEIVKALDLA